MYKIPSYIPILRPLYSYQMALENNQDLSLPSISGMSADSTHTDSLSDDIGSSTLGGLALQ